MLKEFGKRVLVSVNPLTYLILISMAFAFPSLSGQTNTWTGASGGNWSLSSNWSLTHVPTSAEDVVIPDGYNVIVNTAAVCKSFTVNAGGTKNTVTISGTNSLFVIGSLTISYGTGKGDDKVIDVGAGTLTCVSATFANTGNNNRDCIIRVSTGTVTVSGNIIMNGTAGRNQFTFTSSGTLNLGGSISGGDIIPSTGTINFNGTSAQVIPFSASYQYYNVTVNNTAGVTLGASSSGTTLMGDIQIGNHTPGSILNTGNFNIALASGKSETVNANSTLNAGTGVISGNGSFVLNAGASLGIGSADGVTSSGATGNIRTTTRTLNAGATYIYNSTANQNTGTGLPTNLTGVLKISNNGNTVTLNSARTIANGGTVDIIGGTFAAGTNLTMASTSNIIRSGGTMTGTPQGSGTYNVTYPGNSMTTTTELAGVGLNNITVALNSGQTLTLNQIRTPKGNLAVESGTLDLQAFTMNRSTNGGAINIANGATLKIGGSGSFPSNFGSHTFGVSGTVEYSGTAQSIENEQYGNLTLSGSGIKSMPGTALGILGNFTMTGSASATTAAALTVAGNVSLGSTTVFVLPAGKTMTVTGSFASNGSMVINSTVTSSGSLIIKGLSSGNITYNRALTGAMWHMIASPVSGQAISTFATSPANDLASFTSGSLYYGLADYGESGNIWNQYFTSATPGTFTSGKGYEIKRIADGTVSFTGIPGGEVIDMPVSNMKFGWNCVGNPFTSALAINSDAYGVTLNFLTYNASNLDESYSAVYLWIEEPGYDIKKVYTYYRAISNAGYDYGTFYSKYNGVNYIQAGQGFFIKAYNTSTVSFTQGMQAHVDTVSFKTTHVSWPGIHLKATTDGVASFTDVTFDARMTRGLDRTYDAGLLRSNNDFVLYTHLIEDNGVDFSLQCLPDYEYDQLKIPIGLDCTAGGTVTFSAKGINLPAECKPVLFDQLTGIATDLSQDGSSYSANVAANTRGTGRFYLYTSRIGTGISETLTSDIKIYSDQHSIHIEGIVSDGATVGLFDLSGKALYNYRLSPSQNNVVQPAVPAGIYLLVVQDGATRISRKIELN